MNRTFFAPTLSLWLVASVALGQGTTPVPPPRVTPGKDLRPKLPLQKPIPDCTPDRYGQLHCPTPPSAAGTACKTTTGANGIWVQTANASPLVCAKTGDACWTSAGVAGKVWGTTTMVCAGKGDACPASSGAGRVIQSGADVACLGLGDGCTCTTGSTGCKVIGYTADFRTWECAQKTVTCPLTTPATVQLSPTNGQANPVQVSLKGTVRTDPSAVYCSYVQSQSGQPARYSMACPDAATSTIDARWISCGNGGTKVNVKCDVPVTAGATLAPAVLSAMGAGTSTPAPGVVTTFLKAEHDTARTTAFCNYRIDSVTFSATIPCATPKMFGGSYRCY